MRFEEALKAMREGKKAIYNEEVYFIGYDGALRRYKTDDEGILDTGVDWYDCLDGWDLVSEDWEIVYD